MYQNNLIGWWRPPMNECWHLAFNHLNYSLSIPTRRHPVATTRLLGDTARSYFKNAKVPLRSPASNAAFRCRL